MNTEAKSEILQSPELQDRVRALAALGEPIRLAIVDLLDAGDLSPDQLAAALGISGNLLAHHLRVLQDAGVVVRVGSQHDRRRTYVQLASSTLTELLPHTPQINVARVVFVCTHNSARSILADAAWRQVSTVPSTSAGTHPADRINPRARAAARRAGLQIAQAAPQSIEGLLGDDDLVVSVCDAVNEQLPALRQVHIHWSVPDPSSQDTDEAFTAALQDIASRIGELAPRISSIKSTRRAS